MPPIAPSAEGDQLFHIAALQGRVGAASMQPLDLAGEEGARLVRTVADGDDLVEALTKQRVNQLEELAADINTDFRHYLPGKGVDLRRRLSASALHVHLVAAQITE